ncbi:MAG: nucleotidyltransferase domain-containing protein [Chloroflexi bacterium]|nr:nucleotidyltransferase domain-containing protein [Chloroflexota bacterium]MBI5704237.1 nucleotidyltransferase domain-containing protein [Chloroflexota bacterium]
MALANPRRVILFGSAVRGGMDKDSDFDILVVVDKSVHRRQTAQKIYRGLRGVGISVDVIVATEKDLKKYGSKNGTVIKPALQEGRVVYEA